MELTAKYYQMHTDAYPRCKVCHGEGEIYRHFANHIRRHVLFEWLYCPRCFPNSFGYWPSEKDLIEIDDNEFDKLLKEGYRDITGR
jgi:hypothetical protein